MADPAGWPRTLPPNPTRVIKATDLGSTAVLRLGALTLVADPFGDLQPDTRGLGLYLGDTRVLSTLAVLVDGRRPTLLEPDLGGRDRGVIQMTNPELRNDPTVSPASPTLATQSLGIRRERTARGRRPARAADRSPTTRSSARSSAWTCCSTWTARTSSRSAATPAQERGDPAADRGRAVGGRRSGTSAGTGSRCGPASASIPAPDAIGPPRAPATAPFARPGASRSSRARPCSSAGTWRRRGTAATGVAAGAGGAARAQPRPRATARIGGAHPVRVRRRAGQPGPRPGLADIRLLETGGPGPGESFIAAGVPWFATLFGRDAILASLFMLPVLPDLARSTLEVLARRQATARDDWRDAEPGQDPPRAPDRRDGPRPASCRSRPYYGSVDATPLWLLLLAETHAWTGDDALVDRLWPNVLAALDWLQRRGHAGRLRPVRVPLGSRPAEPGLEGLARLGPRSDGRRSPSPRSRCSRSRATRSPPSGPWPPRPLRRGEAALAARAGGGRRRAGRRASRRRSGCRTRALRDGPRRRRRRWPMRSPATSATACGAGALDPARAAPSRATWPGPGCRRAGDCAPSPQGQPGYNPLGYHLGTVWPHDTAIAVAGLKRYGFAAEAAVLATGLLDAARHFPLFRLPGAVLRLPARRTPGMPVAYPVACSPQAWAAAAPFMLFRSLLGLEADAPRRRAADRPAHAAAARSASWWSRACGWATRRWTCCSSPGAAPRVRRSCGGPAISRSRCACRPRGTQPASGGTLDRR